MRDFVEDYGIKLLTSTLYYAQANRQAKAYAIQLSPFDITYGYDVVLPIEVVVPSLRVATQNNLSLREYTKSMAMELEELDKICILAFNHMAVQKKKVLRIYNKRIQRHPGR
ncbi:hypothetical protein P3X46_022017 [Hevea brasiliensis]|uniref:Uncharacterized protein n=1 Tax=Hevea brasiliensis TaxID=3981 RepID=A0ABQ9LHC9_HEVBR|nr:hypothetical protein P3X46_022017 [Hevea brasiliensis]